MPRAATCSSTSVPSPIISLYLPSGSSSEERQAAKFRFMDLFLPRIWPPCAPAGAR
jgi:exonuclease III